MMRPAGLGVTYGQAAYGGLGKHELNLILLIMGHRNESDSEIESESGVIDRGMLCSIA